MTATVISCAFAHRAPHRALKPPPQLRQPPLADFPCRSPASPHFFLSQPACARFEPVQPCQPQPATCPKGEPAAWQVGVVRQEAHDKAVVNLDSMSRPRKFPPQSPRANRQRSPGAQSPNTIPSDPMPPIPCPAEKPPSSPPRDKLAYHHRATATTAHNVPHRGASHHAERASSSPGVPCHAVPP